MGPSFWKELLPIGLAILFLIPGAVITTTICLVRTFGWRYCEQNTSTDCQVCPEHAQCKGQDFVCMDGYDRRDRLCIDVDEFSEDAQAWRLMPEVEACLLHDKTMDRIGKLGQCMQQHGKETESDLLRRTVGMTAKWAVAGDHIIKIPHEGEQRGYPIAYVLLAGILWILLGIFVIQWTRYTG
jgi:uncharacterized integral membrane protein